MFDNSMPNWCQKYLPDYRDRDSSLSPILSRDMTRALQRILTCPPSCQGIAADDEGRLYVADCRNSRVQILTPSGEFLMKLGEHGSRPGQFDQPQGVAIGPSGQLAVVCLENHRVQLF